MNENQNLLNLAKDVASARAESEVLRAILGYVLSGLGQVPEYQQDLSGVLDGLWQRLAQKDAQAEIEDDIGAAARESAALTIGILRQFLRGERPI